ncbi:MULTISPECIES: DedA family protein [unclassified Mesorhizobium]|uniref:DedA family protein n=1 Tax=unclassified Mesorhizobium TaxID=325217 RepID=UPI0003CE93DB|nr:MULTISPECIES: DedA family protein [unclassified Mesorhizobium]ESW68151.1 cytochrome O ubiquinol oxidase [Mesorhizobium sp. LSJC277A00]ESW74465.1 cytochrome O ubiquinol oxidase [Mesorhizobium sp. LSJC285A00]ESW83989.1 cytochrome O ubiquinol oxidase [Mesorhizobium sp. LSJC269B00]ESX13807.1 cytochrome O ubiquinol oxidase [Mesorhizobium sp. LSJC255A00]ESY99152.1 cytochrome O ubiquinol oxidase [Mesorhizobium sp. L2C089B000]
MRLDEITQATIAFMRAHEAWGIPLVTMLAFGESLAFISLLLPATVILVGIGFLIGESGIAFWPLWLAAIVGAALGDWLSFWVGTRLGDRVSHYWPLKRYPDLLPRGHRFFERWGGLGVFIGRFSGPLRASVPLVAGICEMRVLTFQIANVSSAILWATGILAPGAFGLKWLQAWM